MDDITRYRNVKAELTRKGISMKALSEELQVTATFLYLVLSGQRVSRPVARHIEATISADPGSIFPYVLTEPQRGPTKKAVNE